MLATPGDVRRPRGRRDRRARRAGARGRGRHDLPAAPQGRPRPAPARVVSIAPYASRGLRKLAGQLVADPSRRRAGRAATLLGHARLRRRRGRRDPGRRAAGHRPRRAVAPPPSWHARPAPGWPGSRAAPATAVRSRPAACPTCCPVAGRSPTRPPGSTPPPRGASTRLPEAVGRDADAIVAAVTAGELGGLVVGGVDPDDTADPAAARAALEAAVVRGRLELRETEVTRAADVVFPVAPVTDKAGTFVTWEGRPRPFEAVLQQPRRRCPTSACSPASPRSSAGPLGLPYRRRGPRRDGGDRPVGRRPRRRDRPSGRPPSDGSETRRGLATWKQLLDNGRLQDGDPALRADRPRAGRPWSPRRGSASVGDAVTVTGDRGSVDAAGRSPPTPDRRHRVGPGELVRPGRARRPRVAGQPGHRHGRRPVLDSRANATARPPVRRPRRPSARTPGG